jgi:Predicted amino acid aldolase or racemase
MHITDLDTPCLVLDLDVMERNLQSMADYCKTVKVGLRPHIKTHKIPVIAKMQLAAGAIGITAAKPSEAAIMAAAGVRDILIAYPVVSAVKADLLARLVAEGASITVSLDSLASAQCLSAAAVRAEQRFTLLVEIDVGFGRCGVATPELAIELARQITTLPGVRFGGLMYYAGHIFAKGADQDRKLADVNGRVEAAIDALKAAGFDVPIVSGGSSPTARRSAEFTHLTEIRPGMYPLNDRNLLEAGYATVEECALRVLATVVSTAVSGHAILDCGSKTLSSDRLLTGDNVGFGLVVEDGGAVLEKLSEEHGHLNLLRSEHGYRVGDRVSIIPNHVCTTINMHNIIYVARKGDVVGTWEIAARGCVR